MNPQAVSIINNTRPLRKPLHAACCISFFCKLKGLMFRTRLDDTESLLFMEKSASTVSASIHMLFMKFDISVIWLDEHFRVVDKCIAKRWRLIYKPSFPAKYILEAHPSRLDEFSVGDAIAFENA